MSTSLVQTGVKFPDDTVLRSSIPVGATFIQFPGEDPPNSVFGGSWSAIFDNESVFFRTPGGSASSFGSGVQSQNLPEHRHGIGGQGGTVSFRSGGLSGSAWDSGAFSNRRTTNQEITSGELRPVNRTIRVWKRTS